MGQFRISSVEAIILGRHKWQVAVWTSSLTTGIVMYYFSPKVFGGVSSIMVLVCWFITCNFYLGNPLIIYCWIINVFEKNKSFLSLSWNAFRLMMHLCAVTSTTTSTFKFSIWAHIQQYTAPFKTVLKDTLWILFWNCPLGKLERSGKLCFQFQYYYHVAPVQQRLRVTGGFFAFSSCVAVRNYLIGHVHDQSCIHVILQYHPISLQLQLNSQSQFDWVLFKHHWEFPVQKKTIPLLSCYSTFFLFQVEASATECFWYKNQQHTFTRMSKTASSLIWFGFWCWLDRN